MGQVLVNEQYLIDTAAEIKRQLHNDEPITPAEFSSKINKINPNYTPNKKGIIINSIDESTGLPTDVSFVGYTKIPSYCFYYTMYTNGCTFYKAVDNIHLPADLTEIGSYAFYQCTGLKNLYLTDTIKTIGSNAFYYCSNLIFEELPKELTTIGTHAFYYCRKLPLEKLPDGITSIGKYAFYYCDALKLKELPQQLKSIEEYCFYNCTNLVLEKLPDSLEIINNNGLSNCTKISLTELPEGLKTIGTYAFSGCSKITINKIPEGVTTIDRYAFQSCTSITNLSLPANLKTLGDYAFQSCTGLKEITIPKGITNIPQYCFKSCTGLETVTILGDITAVNSYAFNSCSSLTNLILPHVTKVPTCSSSSNLSGTKLASGYIEVPATLVDNFKSTNYWSTYKDNIIPVRLRKINVSNTYINAFKGSKQLEVFYNDTITDDAVLGEQAGYTIEVVGNATLNEDTLMLTLTENANVGDTITVTITSTYNPEITSTQEIEIIYAEPVVELNLNDGQWIDSGETIDGNIVYKSDAGSYNINYGKSIAKITVNNIEHLKLYIRSNAESTYDYTEAFNTDVTASRSYGKYTTKGAQSDSVYKECIYELDDKEHTIEIMYSKDSRNNINDDRGYFYIGEYS